MGHTLCFSTCPLAAWQWMWEELAAGWCLGCGCCTRCWSLSGSLRIVVDLSPSLGRAGFWRCFRGSELARLRCVPDRPRRCLRVLPVSQGREISGLTCWSAWPACLMLDLELAHCGRHSSVLYCIVVDCVFFADDRSGGYWVANRLVHAASFWTLAGTQ